MDVINSAGEFLNSIETRHEIHACMALQRNETKKTVWCIRMGRDQRRSRCVVALA
jgi:hypothetical protein